MIKKIHLLAIISLLAVYSLTGCENMPGTAEEKKPMTITDNTIETAIAKEFEAYPYISEDSIEVEVDNYIVTLSGSTDNILEKEKATDLASMIRGVDAVVNLVDVDCKMVEDQELREKIEYALSADPVLEAYKIIVKVDSGIVSLHGALDSWHQTQLAGDVVKKITGVRKVNNNIAFAYDEDRAGVEIKEDIESLMRNDIRIESGLIDIEIEKGTVILSGKVGSAAEKSLAIVHAYAEGVDSVIAEDLEVSHEARDPLLRKDKYIEKTSLEIINAIQKAFLQDPRLLNHDIEVEVDDGKVTLTGTVSNLRAKNAAEEDARNVVGVWGVKNNITVEPMEFDIPEKVADNVRVAMESHPLFEDYTIVAESDDEGKVTLEGRVHYYFEKEQAEELASKVYGVAEIQNKIDVTEGLAAPIDVTPARPDLPVIRKPQIKSDEQLLDDVNYQLWWSPWVDRNQVDVAVEDGKVTLSGTVNSTMEMRHAVKNAYEGGAFEVDNNLRVDFWEM